MDRITHVHDLLSFLDVRVAFVAHEAATFGFLGGIASLAEGAAGVFHEAGIGQTGTADLTGKTLGVPAPIHSFDDPPDDVLAAFSAAWGVQLLETILAVLPTIKFVEQAFIERTKTLRTHEAIFVVQLAV